MRSSLRGVMLALLVLVASMTVAPVAHAQAACTGGDFSSSPEAGSVVAPGQAVVYDFTVLVVGGPVLGCVRDVRLSPLLDLVSASPAGSHYPDLHLVIVDLGGPHAEGAVLVGQVVTVVRADAPSGAIITTSSAQTVEHEVGEAGTPSTSFPPSACRQGGWRALTDTHGQPFKNQGRCVSTAVAAQR